MVDVDGIFVVSLPLDSVVAGRIAELQYRAAVVSKFGVPHSIDVTLAHDTAALTDANVPMTWTSSRKHGFLGIGHELHQLLGKQVVRQRRHCDQQAQQRSEEPKSAVQLADVNDVH